MGRLSTWTALAALLLLAFAATAVQDVRADVPSENECRPYIEKALHEHELKAEPAVDDGIVSEENDDGSTDGPDSKEVDVADSTAEPSNEEDGDDDAVDSKENASADAEDDGNASDAADTEEANDDNDDDDDDDDDNDADDKDDSAADAAADADDDNSTADDDDDDTNDDDTEEADKSAADEESTEQEASSRQKRSAEDDAADSGADDNDKDDDDDADDDNNSKTDDNDTDDSKEDVTAEEAKSEEDGEEATDSAEAGDDAEDDNDDDDDDKTSGETGEAADDADVDSKEDDAEDIATEENDAASVEADADDDDDDDDKKSGEQEADDQEDSKEADAKSDEADEADDKTDSAEPASAEASKNASADDDDDDDEEAASREKRDASGEDRADGEDGADDDDDSAADKDGDDSQQADGEASKEDEIADADGDSNEEESELSKPVQSFPEDDLLIEYTVPTNLRDHSHVTEILRLDTEFDEKEAAINKVADSVLKDLKKIYENAIKPLETLYKYRDLSNRHFGDPEIFSKPLVLLMGPWSGGKSTILNYLTENEHTADSIRTGAEPSPAYFNILMHGEKPEVLDGTQLAADWTFSGLQKFGQGLEERLRGQKLPHKLLEKVNIVEIPGILEVRKQVSRHFPFNDACQWFIDRADIIFLVYDPSKLDVGPETEAILDQLKGREYQTRILLNKADQVKPEELLRVQGALIWNISPLMSSAQPPVMYTTSLWSHPYEEGAPVRLLQAQERALLRDLRTAIDKRIDNKIASARRFAVRVRNHAKMVDCYLTTYYNHKTLFGNKNQIATNIIENPQNYHIYEGLSTLTNISRYDLPDPDVYRDFFRLNKLYDFQKLSETCTYFRGCPINKLDISIAYELPELVGKYKKAAEAALVAIEKQAEKQAGKS